MTDPADPGNAGARSADQEGAGNDEGAPWGDVERARRASAEVRDTPSAELTSTEDARQTKKDRTWNRILRLAYGVILLVLLTGQVAIADYVFYLYGEQGLRAGRKAVTSDRPWKRDRNELGVRFVLWGFEASYGHRHGWHPHHHVLLFCEPGAQADLSQEYAEQVLSRSWNRWCQGLETKNLNAVASVAQDGVHEPAGFDVRVLDSRNPKASAGYVFKMCLDPVRSTPERSRNSRTPFEIMACYASAQAGADQSSAATDLALIHEWSETLTDLRVRQCPWPPGMRAWFSEKAAELESQGPLLETELTDEEIAAAEEPESQTIAHVNPTDYSNHIAYELETLKAAARVGGVPAIVAWFDLRGLQLTLTPTGIYLYEQAAGAPPPPHCVNVSGHT